MTPRTDSQIDDWLKKLERESWQLELLVSAFTIFLLIGATVQYDEFLTDLQFRYNFNETGLVIGFIFLILLKQALFALTICLVAHLMLRGFWIGTIGLRSVQSSVDFDGLKYSELFTRKLKKKVISLDQLVIRLDEICSVIFSFAFLIIFTLVAFGLYVGFLGALGFLISSLSDMTPDGWDKWIAICGGILFMLALISGLIYLIDFFTLGFFKKFKWVSKIYYPIYFFFSYVTLAILSRSIYYYMISKFSKNRIRIVFIIGILFIATTSLFDFDHFPYFPENTTDRFLVSNMYDDLRESGTHIASVSISSRYINEPFFQIFLRYNPSDNDIISDGCPDFETKKKEGLNPRFNFNTSKGNVNIGSANFDDEESSNLLKCLSSIYQISVNDSVYSNLSYHFFIHPEKGQEGLLVTIPTESFSNGENLLAVGKVNRSDSVEKFNTFAQVPFWYKED